MSIQVTIPPFLRDLTGGLAAVEVSGSTVGDCLSYLIQQFPGLNEQILDDGGDLHEYVGIYINGISTHPLDLAHLVKDGDQILILNVIAGG